MILTGRYTGNGHGTIRLKGKMSGHDFVREIPVDFSNARQHDVLATLWARTRVDDLMSQDFKGAQQGAMKDDVKQAITQLGLDYRLMTQFTSFVAVEEMVVTDGGQPRRIDVPVEVPEGVNRAAVFDQESLRPMGTLNASFGRNASGFYLPPPSPPQANAQTVVETKSGTSRAKKRAVGSGGGSGDVASSSPPSPARPVIIADESVAMDGRRTLSPEERKRSDLQSKLHPSVLAVIDRLKDPKAKPSADETKFIHNGKAEIQIWLTEKSDANMAKLKELGFEVVLDPKTAKLVIGRIPIEKLAVLAELKFVRYVGPQMFRSA